MTVDESALPQSGAPPARGWRLWREGTPQGNLDALRQCWRTRNSLVLLPAKTAMSEGEVVEALESLPSETARGHFAMLTSGSSGAPKLVVGEMARAEKLAQVLHQVQQSEPVDAAIIALPLSYSFAFVNQWVWAEVHGRALTPTAGLADPAQLRAALLSARSAMLCLVGVQVPLLFQYFSSDTFPGVSRLHFAGGRFPQEHLPALAALFPQAQVFNNFGCAEAMPRLCVREACASSDPADVGVPLPGVDLRIDEEGALLFRSPYGAIGFFEQGRFQAIGTDTWTRSGDLAQCTPDGRWRLNGRPGEVFKRHGEKVSLPSVLGTVASAWAGRSAAYLERDRHGEQGWVLVLAPVPDDSQVRPVLAALRRHHARAHWPLRIEGLADLPLLANGKLDTLSLASRPDALPLWRQPL